MQYTRARSSLRLKVVVIPRRLPSLSSGSIGPALDLPHIPPVLHLSPTPIDSFSPLPHMSKDSFGHLATMPLCRLPRFPCIHPDFPPHPLKLPVLLRLTSVVFSLNFSQNHKLFFCISLFLTMMCLSPHWGSVLLGSQLYQPSRPADSSIHVNILAVM